MTQFDLKKTTNEMLRRKLFVRQIFVGIVVFIAALEAKLYTIKIHDNDAVCKVDEHFLSIAVGTFHARQRFKAFDFSSQKLKNVMSALRPAYLRLGGSDSNFLVFRPGPRKLQPTQPTMPTQPGITIQETTTATTTAATTTEATTTAATTTEAATTVTTTTEEKTTTPKTTTTEQTTTAKTTTNKPTTTKSTTPEPTTKRATTQPKPLTTPQQATTPRPTQAPVTEMQQWTPATSPPGTTPSQMQLPNVDIAPTGSPPSSAPVGPWGSKNSEMEKNDSENDDQEVDGKKDSEKGGQYYAEDLKDSKERTAGTEAAENQEALSSQSQSVTSYQINPANVNQEEQIENSQTRETSDATLNYTTSGQNIGESSLSGQQQEANAMQNTAAIYTQYDAQSATQSSSEVLVDQQQQQFHDAKPSNDASRRKAGISIEAEKRNQMQITTKRSSHQKYPFWLSADDFDRFVKFVENTGLDLIFDINGFFRRPDGSWDATNAMDVLSHVEDKEYKICYEMGNEPNRYGKYGKSRKISALQQGLDMIRLRSLLQRNKKYRSKLIGPGISRPGIREAQKYLEEFLNIASWAIDAITWHQYYVSKKATLSDFINPETLDLFEKQIVKINKVAEKTHAGKPVWLGETGSAWGGGAPGISDTFAASFMFLDKLGLAGLYCNQVVIRQSLLGGSYALLDDDFTPRPDYWVGLMHKKLVGRKVFKVSGGSTYLRVYAHCTKERAGYPKGAVTVIAMNLLKKTKAQIKFKDLKNNFVEQYLITTSNGKLRSKNVDLNGEELRLKDGIHVPKIHPKQVKTPLTLPPMTLAFYVIPYSGFLSCM